MDDVEKKFPAPAVAKIIVFRAEKNQPSPQPAPAPVSPALITALVAVAAAGAELSPQKDEAVSADMQALRLAVARLLVAQACSDRKA